MDIKVYNNVQYTDMCIPCFKIQAKFVGLSSDNNRKSSLSSKLIIKKIFINNFNILLNLWNYYTVKQASDSNKQT